MAFANHDYAAAFDYAARGYAAVRTAAVKAGVTVQASNNGLDGPPAVRGRPPNEKEYSHVDRYGPRTKRSAK